MIMIRDLMAVAIVGVHQINDVLMGVTMFFDLCVVFRDDLRKFCKIMGDRTGVRRKDHAQS
jgi:wobble nucleotide-excising tRNase